MNSVANIPFSEIQIGQVASMSKTITEEDVVRFAEVTGDFNPVHLDEEFARDSMFGRRIAHGFLTGALISAVLGTRLPGANTIYLEQTMRFLAPVGIGDTITAECEVLEKIPEKKILVMRTTVTNQDGVKVLDGQARVMKWEKDSA
ncbi:MAG: MaoC family dehydratase [Deltaproteobacteria bacterium]|nr:MAG: MaoC family dehydratase [Deltaproteobacteria bacterium]